MSTYLSLAFVLFLTLSQSATANDQGLMKERPAIFCDPADNILEHLLTLPENLAGPGEFSLYNDAEDKHLANKELVYHLTMLDVNAGYAQIFQPTRFNQIVSFALYRASKDATMLVVVEDGVSVQNPSVFACDRNKWTVVSPFPKIEAAQLLELYKAADIIELSEKRALTLNTLFETGHSEYRYVVKPGPRIKAIASHPSLLDKDAEKVLFRLNLNGREFHVENDLRTK